MILQYFNEFYNYICFLCISIIKQSKYFKNVDKKLGVKINNINLKEKLI
jgi:hypothetical protein